MNVIKVNWSDIKHIPETYDTGGASFSGHRQKQQWFAIENLDTICCVSKTLFVSRDIARICSIWVHPVFRKKGLATFMINHQVKHAKALKFKKIQAISKEKIFQNYGFTDTERYKKGSAIWELML